MVIGTRWAGVQPVIVESRTTLSIPSSLAIAPVSKIGPNGVNLMRTTTTWVKELSEAGAVMGGQLGCQKKDMAELDMQTSKPRDTA